MRYTVKVEFTTEVTDNGVNKFTECVHEYDNIIDAVNTFNDYTKFMTVNETKKAVIIDTKNNEIIAIKEK